MLYANMINDIGQRSSNRSIKKTLKLLSDEENSELGLPRKKILHFRKCSGNELLHVDREKTAWRDGREDPWDSH